MIRCNDEGIPKLVQSIEYRPSGYVEGVYRFNMFNGNHIVMKVDEENITNGPESPETMEFAEFDLLRSYSPPDLLALSTIEVTKGITY